MLKLKLNALVLSNEKEKRKLLWAKYKEQMASRKQRLNAERALRETYGTVVGHEPGNGLTYETNEDEWRTSTEKLWNLVHTFRNLPMPRDEHDEQLLASIHWELGWRHARDISGHDYFNASLHFA